MSFGPRAGWMEINLPALSPGSSIMPGKINPTVPEMVIQIAHQVCGNDVAITMAVDEDELDLNVWDATFYKCLFENMQILGAEIPFCVNTALRASRPMSPAARPKLRNQLL